MVAVMVIAPVAGGVFCIVRSTKSRKIFCSKIMQTDTAACAILMELNILS